MNIKRLITSFMVLPFAVSFVSGCSEPEETSVPSGTDTTTETPEPEKVTVEFISGKEVYLSYEIEKGTTVPRPDKPTKIGYTFVDWLNEDGSKWHSSVPIEEDIKVYANYEYDFLEIPAIIINVENNEDITSKEEYKPAQVSLKNTKTEWQFENLEAGIRGRGNSSWYLETAKKPYRIKFDSKQSLFGSKKAKSWTLIANHSDKSLSRNYIAYEFGKAFDGIDFVSMHQPVDLYLNDDYRGVYLLCDQIQTGKGRVDIDESIAIDGNNGYFIERDGHEPYEGVEGVDYFFVDGERYVFKTPDTEAADYLQNKEVEIEYITNYMSQAKTAIKSGEWSDVDNSIDIDSFADSYLVDELFANNDCGYSSCYYYKDKDGKFFKGPLWDFDIGAGNAGFNYGDTDQCLPNNGLWAAKHNTWYKALLERDEFVNIIKDKLVTYRTKFDNVMKQIDVDNEDSIYSLYKNALERNFERWPVMGESVWPEPTSVVAITTLTGQIRYLHSWLSSRYLYLSDLYSNL